MIFSLAASIVQVFLSFALGWSIIQGRSFQNLQGEEICQSIPTGIFLGTMILFLLHLTGISFHYSVLGLAVVSTTVFFFCLWKRHGNIPRLPHFSFQWYEIALMLFIFAKIVFAFAMMWQTPLFFEDAMTHWSGRARALYGGVNWSFDSESPVFLGLTGSKHYPLGLPLYRAATAVIGGRWDDVIARADGVVFYGIVVAAVWFAVRRFSKERWLAAAGAFVVAAVPLQIVHAVSGYGDIAVEAFFAGAVATLLRREWLVAGVLAAGTAWIKNDGLIIAIPPLFVMACLLQGRGRWPLRSLGKEDGKNILLFLSGLLPLVPWLVFKAIHGLGVSPGGQSFAYHAEAWSLLRDTVLLGSTHLIFWVFTVIVLLTCGREYFRDQQGTALLSLFTLSLISVVIIFTCTDAYAFLENQTTIHRTMLQLYGMTVIVVFYGINLKLHKSSVVTPEPDKTKKSRRQKKQ